MGCAGYGAPGNLRLLLSYDCFRKLKRERLIPVRMSPVDAADVDIIVDSGVYTARRRREMLSVESYGLWLSQNAGWYNEAITIDYPSRFSCIQANTERLDAIVPGKVTGCVQGFMTRDEIRAVMERWSYVAVGTAGFNASGKARAACWTNEEREARLRYFDTVFEESARAGGRRLHGLAITQYELLLRFPWHSVDSASWVAAASYGLVHLFDPRSGTMTIVRVRRRDQVMDHAELNRSVYGEDPALLLDPDISSRGYLHRLYRMSSGSYRKMEAWMVARWRRIGAGSDYTLRLYLVDSGGKTSKYMDSSMSSYSSGKRRRMLLERWGRQKTTTVGATVTGLV